jgi:uncharacterized protein YlxW (UPF0749 family)
MASPNRYICDVLDEMRTCQKMHNYSYLLSLVEEVQTMANRMEASLHDKRDLRSLQKELRSLSAQRNTLEDEIEKLKQLKLEKGDTDG